MILLSSQSPNKISDRLIRVVHSCNVVIQTTVLNTHSLGNTLYLTKRGETQ